MSVVIVDYDPQWPRDFEALRARIWRTVEGVAVSIEHVGSTSVPGLAAKPVLDIDIIVESDEAVHHAFERLAKIGYTHRGNLGIEGRDAFRAAINDPAHNLYVCRQDSAALHDHLTFRDYLRTNPETAKAYADLKRTLAAQFPSDVNSYATAKTDFITGVLETAGTSAARIAEIRRENSL
jgi:GrpB-like predicted nucleotidyltransferase (UPF0157 family)